MDFHLACARKITIGRSVLIAGRVFITDLDHSFNHLNVHILEQGIIAHETTIGDYCWIGENAIILKGVSIGKNSIVGANSVVTKSFVENSIIAGVPARLIGKRS